MNIASDLISSVITTEQDYISMCANFDKTILIQIPSYKDKDILNTVYSAFQQADFPERVHFAICYQDDDMRTLHKLKSIPNVKVDHIFPKDARGACYARWRCQQLIDWDNPEDFTLHTDSHMRFSKGWDTFIINKYMTYYEKDPMAIMSTYPPSSNKWLDKKFDDPAYSDVGHAVAICARGFHKPTGHFIKLTPDTLSEDDCRINSRTVFVSGGYFFSAIDVDKHVLYDKHMLQLGDELPYSIRLFTYGYNVYVPDSICVYHEYTRSDAARPVMNRKDHDAEFRRIDTLLQLCPPEEYVDLGEFGLGTKRTLDEYTEYSGIDFKSHKISIKATRGLFGENAPENGDDVDLPRYREMLLYKKIKEYTIHLVVYNLFDKEYDDTSTAYHALQMAEDSSRINIIEINCDKNAPYGVWQKAAMDRLSELNVKDDDYVLFVDNSFRFISTWDTNFVISHFYSGEKTVISNTDNTIQATYDLNKLPIFDNFYVKPTNIRLPSFELCKGDMIMSQTLPTRHMFVTHGLLFMQYKTLLEIPFDESLNYSDFVITYSARLFTCGYDVYYPVHSRVMRYETEENLYRRDGNFSNKNATAVIFNNNYSSMDTGCCGSYGVDRAIEQFAKEAGFDLKTYTLTPKNI